LQKRERGRDGEIWSRETAKLILMAFTKATLPSIMFGASMYYWHLRYVLSMFGWITEEEEKVERQIGLGRIPNEVADNISWCQVGYSIGCIL
jgi:hypothetical protein